MLVTRLRLLQRKSHIETNNRFVLVDSGSNVEPFSFFNMLFVNKQNYSDKEYNAILHHEQAHIQLKHSIDKLLLELILIIQWFNPFVWLLKRDLKELHEFQADLHTINRGVEPTFYKQLLLSKAMGTRFAFGNNLNHSLIKKRLKMINNRINKSIGLPRILAITSVLALMFIAFACEQKNDKVYTDVDVMAEYPGGMEAMKGFIVENLKYPETENAKGVEGKVFVSFIVDKTGAVRDAKIEKSVNEVLDSEALRVVSSLSQWIPAEKNGKKVSTQYTIPIVFKQPEEVFNIVEDMPMYPGGMDEFKQYIRQNVAYPKSAKEAAIEGKTFVAFEVSAEGMVENATVTRTSGNDALDAEAIRVIMSSPAWQPGMQAGQPVATKFTMPVQFLMTDKGGAIVVNNSQMNKEKMIVHVETMLQNGKQIAAGSVFDKNNKPLSGMAVVIEGTNRGTITDAEGNFSLEFNANEKLVISGIGKETTVWSGE